MTVDSELKRLLRTEVKPLRETVGKLILDLARTELEWDRRLRRIENELLALSGSIARLEGRLPSSSFAVGATPSVNPAAAAAGDKSGAEGAAISSASATYVPALSLSELERRHRLWLRPNENPP
jgi:hypothetical protein